MVAYDISYHFISIWFFPGWGCFFFFGLVVGALISDFLKSLQLSNIRLHRGVLCLASLVVLNIFFPSLRFRCIFLLMRFCDLVFSQGLPSSSDMASVFLRFSNLNTFFDPFSVHCAFESLRNFRCMIFADTMSFYQTHLVVTSSLDPQISPVSTSPSIQFFSPSCSLMALSPKLFSNRYFYVFTRHAPHKCLSLAFPRFT